MINYLGLGYIAAIRSAWDFGYVFGVVWVSDYVSGSTASISFVL